MSKYLILFYTTLFLSSFNLLASGHPTNICLSLDESFSTEFGSDLDYDLKGVVVKVSINGIPKRINTGNGNKFHNFLNSDNCIEGNINNYSPNSGDMIKVRILSKGNEQIKVSPTGRTLSQAYKIVETFSVGANDVNSFDKNIVIEDDDSARARAFFMYAQARAFKIAYENKLNLSWPSSYPPINIGLEITNIVRAQFVIQKNIYKLPSGRRPRINVTFHELAHYIQAADSSNYLNPYNRSSDYCVSRPDSLIYPFTEVPYIYHSEQSDECGHNLTSWETEFNATIEGHAQFIADCFLMNNCEHSNYTFFLNHFNFDGANRSGNIYDGLFYLLDQDEKEITWANKWLPQGQMNRIFSSSQETNTFPPPAINTSNYFKIENGLYAFNDGQLFRFENNNGTLNQDLVFSFLGEETFIWRADGMGRIFCFLTRNNRLFCSEISSHINSPTYSNLNHPNFYSPFEKNITTIEGDSFKTIQVFDVKIQSDGIYVLGLFEDTNLIRNELMIMRLTNLNEFDVVLRTGNYSITSFAVNEDTNQIFYSDYSSVYVCDLINLNITGFQGKECIDEVRYAGSSTVSGYGRGDRVESLHQNIFMLKILNNKLHIFDKYGVSSIQNNTQDFQLAGMGKDNILISELSPRAVAFAINHENSTFSSSDISLDLVRDDQYIVKFKSYFPDSRRNLISSTNVYIFGSYAENVTSTHCGRDNLSANLNDLVHLYRGNSIFSIFTELVSNLGFTDSELEEFLSFSQVQLMSENCQSYEVRSINR